MLVLFCSSSSWGGPEVTTSDLRETSLPSATQTQSLNAPLEDPTEGRHLAIAATLGYSTALSQVYGLDIDPFRESAGLTIDYVFSSGFALGLYGELFLGTPRQQVYEPRTLSAPIPLTVDSSLISTGLAASFLQPLGAVQLRYRTSVGASLVRWDFGDLDHESIAGYSPLQGEAVSLHVEPALAIFWPTDYLNPGLEGFCRLEFGSQIPTACGARLHAGVRF